MSTEESGERRTSAADTPRKTETQDSRRSAATAADEEQALRHKQEVVEQLFRHTNAFLAEHREDPLLVVEALAAILVRYAALLGPVEQLPKRLEVLQKLIGLECRQVQEIADSGQWQGKPPTA